MSARRHFAAGVIITAVLLAISHGDRDELDVVPFSMTVFPADEIQPFSKIVHLPISEERECHGT